MVSGSSSHDLIGRRLGEFVIREHLGEGGFGMVFRADQPILERAAVIKVATVRGVESDPAVQRFLGEARLASRLDHPFAAHVYAFGAEPDGLLWIAMELVRGTPLDTMIAETGPLSLDRAIPFLSRLCEVVHTAHEQGIVHRDLKPANVMVVSRAGSVFPKLLDLGIAVDLKAPADPSGSQARTAGTPLYMAPEMWLDARKAGAPADIYALGALTYEILKGKPPYEGRSVMEIAAKHARVPPPQLGDPFPSSLDAAIAKAMAKRVPNRFASALELGDALRQASGVGLDAVNLARLDELTRDELVMRAPQPIAEAVAVLDAARTPANAREALWQTARTCAQYVALVALACHTRSAGKPMTEQSVPLLEELHRKGLDTAGWWRLARELCRPFVAIRDAHPIPELIGLFFEDRSTLRTAMEVLLDAARPGSARAGVARDDPGPNASVEDQRKFLVGAVPALAAVLRSIAFLQTYRLAVTTEDGAEEWMGARRPARAAIELSRPGRARTSLAREEPADRALLVDGKGALVVALDGVAQVGPPSPGAPPELFWLDGPGRQNTGARLLALPGRLERTDRTMFQALGIEDAQGATKQLGDDAAPYRGLMTFTETDAGLFFGREREVEGFVNRLRTMPLIAVVGPSGAGKSSFVRAGVLPTLGPSWGALVARPGATPLANLCARLATQDVAITADELRADPDLLGVRLRARARALGTSMLLVIDQFEELITLSVDPAEHNAYASALLRAARTVDDTVRVVVTLRDDFLVRIAQLPTLRDRIATSLQILTTPVAADLLRILVEPARRAGFEFEDAALPNEMVEAVENQPAALALLSFTAQQLWQFRDRQYRQLPRKAYKALGGVGGALAQHAETTLDAMTDDDRKIVREMFRHLVTADGTRAVLSRPELLQVSGGTTADPVLERLIQARLLVAMEAASGESIEVVHEALLSAWPRLVRWRHEDAESARLRDQLRVAARQWAERERARGLLWRGEALTEYQLWRARYPGSLTDVEEAFGRASVADAVRGRRLRRAALITVLAGLSIALVIFARLRSVAEDNRVAAEESGERARAGEVQVKQSLVESQIEAGRRSLVDGKPADALLFLDEAMRNGADTPAIRFMIARALEPLDAELATLPSHTGQLFDVRLSGKRALTAGDDGKARLWDVAGGPPLRVFDGPKGIGFARWLGDDTIITARPDGSLVLWDAATGAQRAALTGNTHGVNHLELSPTNAHVLVGTAAGTAHVWDVATKKSVVLGKELPGWRVLGTFSARGDLIAVTRTEEGTSAGDVVLWTPTGQQKRAFVGHKGGVRIARFDAKAERLATAGADHTGRIFDVASGRVLHVLRGHDQPVRDVAWNADGSLVATGSLDTTVKIWDTKTGEAVRTLRGHTGAIARIQFLRDGTLITIAGDGAAKLWEVRRGVLLATFGHSGYLFELDIDRDEHLLATASWEGTAKLWDLRRRIARTLVGQPTSTPFVPPPLLTSDGRHVVRHDDKGVEIWTLADGSRKDVAAAAPVMSRAIDNAGGGAFTDKTGAIVQFGLDGRTVSTWAGGVDAGTAIAMAPSGAIATAGSAGALVVWGPSHEVKKRVQLEGPASGLEWSRDGRSILAMVGEPPAAVMLSSELEVRAKLDGTFRALFSPDGKLLASAHDAELRLTGADGSDRGRLALGSQAIDFAWSPSSDRLYIGEVDGSVEVWSRSPAGTWSRNARLGAHSAYVSSITSTGRGEMFVTSSADATVKVWDATTLRQVHGVAAPPGTLGASLDPTGQWLVTTDDTSIDVWRASLSTMTSSALAELVRCRLPYRLDGQAIVRRAISECK